MPVLAFASCVTPFPGEVRALPPSRRAETGLPPSRGPPLSPQAQNWLDFAQGSPRVPPNPGRDGVWKAHKDNPLCPLTHVQNF